MASRVAAKGQVAIPKWARARLGIVTGDRVEFELADDGRLSLRKVGAEPAQSRFEAVWGIAGEGMSTDEFMAMLRD